MIDIDFIMAGKATFTIANPNNDRYTFKVEYSDALDRTFVYLMTGPSNEIDYTYMGMIVNYSFIITRKSKFSHDSMPVKVFEYALLIAQGKKPLPTGYFFEHNGKCGRCGRKLTTPESIKSGLGPICRGK